jgi:hypothetical protein
MQHHIAGWIRRDAADYASDAWFAAVTRLKQALARSTSHCDTTPLSDLAGLSAELDQLDWSQELMIITDESWTKSCQTAIEHHLVACAGARNRPILIVTHGYRSRQIGPGVWQVSWPSFFLKSSQYCSSEFPQLTPGLARGFSSLNRRPALHRLRLGLELHQQGLLSQVIFSLGAEDPEAWRAVADSWPGFADFVGLLPMELDDHLPNDHTINHRAYREAYCNIVTETDTEWDLSAHATTREIITEKSYKPFLSGQIPLFLAAPGHMAYLASLGFEVMWDLVPAGYDLMSTLHKIQAIAHTVARGPGWIEEFYWAHLPEIQHNWAWIQSGQVERRLTDSIQQLIDPV